MPSRVVDTAVIAEAERFYLIEYRGPIVAITCALCSHFELLVERSEAGQKLARDRTALHLRAAHDCK